MDMDAVVGQLFEEASVVLKKIADQYYAADVELPDFIDVTIQQNTLNGQVDIGIKTGDIHPIQ